MTASANANDGIAASTSASPRSARPMTMASALGPCTAMRPVRADTSSISTSPPSCSRNQARSLLVFDALTMTKYSRSDRL